MAALAAIACNTISQLWELAKIFAKSGDLKNILLVQRRNHTISNYLRNTGLDSSNFTINCYLNAHTTEFCEDNASMTNADVVYRCPIVLEPRDGLSLRVLGEILPTCERFSINLVMSTPGRDIALHINPRLPQNYIVRNSCVGGVWGNEERTSALPFSLHRGSNFIIQVLFTTNCYLISVNGRHVASFNHRLPYNKVKCLEVKGDVHDVQSDQAYAENYPEIVKNSKRLQNIRHLEDEEDPEVAFTDNKIHVPFFGRMHTSFRSGQVLHIRARLKLLPHSFYINLQVGDKIWPHPLIHYHFNPRFANTGGRHIICQNSWMVGDWGREERSECPMEFVPGKIFNLRIQPTFNSYNVYLDGGLISEYFFREEEAKIAAFHPDTVYIQGDIQLLGVYVQNSYEEYPTEEY
ncbi:Galectin [Sergentomyia squamirostris]